MAEKEKSLAQRSSQYVDVIRLWKDEEYRKSLTEEELRQFEEESTRIMQESAQLPGNPAGVIELTDDELRQALSVGATCSEYGSISTTWCDNPKIKIDQFPVRIQDGQIQDGFRPPSNPAHGAAGPKADESDR